MSTIISSSIRWAGFIFLRDVMGLDYDAAMWWRKRELRQRFPGENDTQEVIYQRK